MSLLRELHEEGATICMVTHDPRFAAHAERQVHLFDGKVVAEGELLQLLADPAHNPSTISSAARA
jgi:putative ABC transport system ATP-binding protein